MNLKDVRITEGFWKKRKEINKKISFYAILKTFEDSGRIRSLTKDLKDDETHHIFWESDLAKLMETAFFILNHEHDDKLINICNDIIDKIIHNQEEDGYLNSYFSFNEPENKFTNLRVRHELYCAGHLAEDFSINSSSSTGINLTSIPVLAVNREIKSSCIFILPGCVSVVHKVIA